MKQEQAARLLQAGKEMRKAQKKYERTHNFQDNRVRLETQRIFDELLEACAQGAKQGSLLTQHP